MAQLSQIKTVTVAGLGGLPLQDKPGSFKPSGTKREHKAGTHAANGGYTEAPTAAELKVKLNATGIDVQALGAVIDSDITVKLADGSTHVMFKAFASESAELDDGTISVTFMSNISEKIG